jgi:hypothetical protein
VFEWKIRGDVCPGPGRAVQVDRAAQGLDAVGEAGQAGCPTSSATAVNTSSGAAPRATSVATRRSAACSSAS